MISVTEPMNYKVLTQLMLLTSCVAGCAATDSRPTETLPQPEPTTMSFEHATDLVLKHKDAFQSAYVLASQRPAVKHEIAEFALGVTSDNGEGEIDSITRFDALPG